MTAEIVLTVPARHLIPGDHTAGFVVSQMKRFPDGTTEFELVWPHTTHSAILTVQEKDLDAISFPLTKRGDDYSPNARNAALGLPPAPEKAYVEPEPIARYRVGTRLEDVKHFDRGQHIRFACTAHQNSAWSSKDPYSSSWFPQSEETEDCRHSHHCMVPLGDYILTHEYRPTRNG